MWSSLMQGAGGGSNETSSGAGGGTSQGTGGVRLGNFIAPGGDWKKPAIVAVALVAAVYFFTKK